MNKLLKKIYESVITYEEDTIKMGGRVELEIKELIKQDAEQWSDKEMDKIKNLMYQAALTAEQEGFELGIRYTLKLIFEIMAD